MTKSILIAAFFCAFAGAARAECGTDLEAEEAKVSAAKTCREARAIYEACLWGSTADVGRGATTRTKCEADFLPGANAATKARYNRALSACAKKYARMDGSMYRSAAASCAADAAFAFARKARAP